MVLIVIAVETIAAHGLQIFNFRQVIFYRFNPLLVPLIINGISFGRPYDHAVNNFLSGCKFEFADFFCSEFDELAVVSSPYLICLKAEIFQSKGCCLRVWNHFRAPVFEILYPSDSDFWRMNVYPVVGEDGRLVDDQAYREEIPVSELLSSIEDLVRRWGLDGKNQLP